MGDACARHLASSMVESTADDHLTVDGDAQMFVVGAVVRRLHQAPSSWRAQASPIRPEQPSLASVGGGMAAAGAAFAHPRVREPRSRPIFLTNL